LRSDISIGFISLSGDRLAFFKLSFSARVRAENEMAGATRFFVSGA